MGVVVGRVGRDKLEIAVIQLVEEGVKVPVDLGNSSRVEMTPIVFTAL